MNKKFTSQALYGIIRKSDDGHQFILPSEVSYLAEMAQMKADETDHELPQWAEGNKQVRLCKLEMVEIA